MSIMFAVFALWYYIILLFLLIIFIKKIVFLTKIIFKISVIETRTFLFFGKTGNQYHYRFHELINVMQADKDRFKIRKISLFESSRSWKTARVLLRDQKRMEA